MEVTKLYQNNNDLNLKATELRLGLPGTQDEVEKQSVVKSNKRSSPEINCSSDEADKASAIPPKAQVIGWPPVRSYRKNAFQQKKDEQTEGLGTFVKVSMDGAPYLRKIDLKLYKSYSELVKGLEIMFKCNIGEYHEREGYNNNGSDNTPTYEDKDGDWMLVGDVPWDMFLTSCKRMRIMKSSDANGIISS